MSDLNEIQCERASRSACSTVNNLRIEMIMWKRKALDGPNPAEAEAGVAGMLEGLRERNRRLNIWTTKMLKWLEIYWSFNEANGSGPDPCPVCGDGTGDDCEEVAWNNFDEYRKKLKRFLGIEVDK